MRSKARDCAFKVIFANEFGAENESRRAVYRAAELDDEEIKYADTLIALVERHRDEFAAVLDKYAIGFSEKRMFPVDKSVLMLALAEIMYVDDVPAVVSVDEAVGLVKKYSTEKSAGFVNGVLAAIIAGEKNEHLD